MKNLQKLTEKKKTNVCFSWARHVILLRVVKQKCEGRRAWCLKNTPKRHNAQRMGAIQTAFNVTDIPNIPAESIHPSSVPREKLPMTRGEDTNPMADTWTLVPQVWGTKAKHCTTETPVQKNLIPNCLPSMLHRIYCLARSCLLFGQTRLPHP